MSHKFQIHLRGIIDLLSKHLYSGPQVYLRELLQNGVDAIQARRRLEPTHAGAISLEPLRGRPGAAPTLLFTDNGVGLTEAEIHEFLATIGQSSKRGDGFERPVDFLGQFGVGLLSCFVVSDEIVVLTRSAKDPSSPPLEWRGRHDGTYTVKTIQHDLAAGTQVYLTAKAGAEEWFDADRVRTLAKHFGGLLLVPIQLVQGNHTETINEDGAPWRRKQTSRSKMRSELLAYGRELFETDFLDAIPLQAEAGRVDGVAFVLPQTPSLAHKRTHRVYLKNMLLSEQAEGLLPDWAFFVKCVLNAQDLRPMASRESFAEDDLLSEAREQLGRCIRDYLLRLAEDDAPRLRKLLQTHYLAFKALASQDDEVFRVFIDLLPFETSLGTMTLPEYRRDRDAIQYVPQHDQFRQISGVAAAQELAIINGGYTYDLELLEKYGEIHPDVSVEAVDPASFTQTFEELTLEEQDAAFAFLKAADAALRPYRCGAEVKRFLPAELPTLYTVSREGDFLRSVEQAQEISSGLWAGVLGNLANRPGGAAFAQLCFNFRNPLVRKLATLTNSSLLKRAIEMLYVQALLQGHYPLRAKELQLFNTGLLDLIEHCVSAGGEKKA